MTALKVKIIDISNISVLLGKYNPASAEYLDCLKQLGRMQQDVFDYLENLVEEQHEQ